MPTEQDGYDLEITRAVADAVKIPVVASGGAGFPEHLFQAVTAGGASAALAASIFHYGTYTIDETKQYLAERGVPIRFNPIPALASRGRSVSCVRLPAKAALVTSG